MMYRFFLVIRYFSHFFGIQSSSLLKTRRLVRSSGKAFSLMNLSILGLADHHSQYITDWSATVGILVVVVILLTSK